MRQAVKDYFIKFSQPLEGVVYTMYQDSKGLVTTGMGNLIEPINLGWGYPWKRKDGSLATQSEYIAEWNTINSIATLAHDGWVAASRYCKLHLDPEDVQAIVEAKLLSNEARIKTHVETYDEMCSDGQLMLHSWAWAVGPDAGYGRMFKLLNAKAYSAAANECDINPKVGTIILRNAANRQLLINAAGVRDMHLDPDVLIYPGTASSGLIKLPQTDGFVRTLEEYDHQVVTLQHALNMLGFDLQQNGVAGPITNAAVLKFQKSHGLKVDGVVGPLTWHEIHQALRFR